MRRLWLLPLLVLSACLHPPSLQEGDVLRRINADYRQFFPAAADPDLIRDAGLLRPRFGLPAIVPADAPDFSFDVDLLQRGPSAPVTLTLLPAGLSEREAAACSDSGREPCLRLVVKSTESSIISAGAVRLRLHVAPQRADLRPSLGAYDLYVT